MPQCRNHQLRIAFGAYQNRPTECAGHGNVDAGLVEPFERHAADILGDANHQAGPGARMHFTTEVQSISGSTEADALADGILAGPEFSRRGFAHDDRSALEIGTVPSLLRREVASSHNRNAQSLEVVGCNQTV